MDKNIKKGISFFFIPVVWLRVNVGLCFIRPLKKKKKKKIIIIIPRKKKGQYVTPLFECVVHATNQI